ncbi:flagellar hook assembly protein FlgD [Bacillus suaedae]|uniref:Flagellar hook assembly protein FlgD n=1 Tax=Halalkalibacter suaedae TaxID=2822140 RepID=A0A941AR56_9BACI|nr:flagellar hook assembly protein FlgD [Bacillus suaedae]MBP3952033.1 flagellar hook assembly protein FlgD [Bacillus suaedae]
MTTINEALLLQNNQGKTQASSKSTLGKDDFLKILIAQLQNQDPSNPMDDREFIAQMSQFSSLEQMTNMNQSIQNFVNLQTSQNLIQHSELIGKKVQWKREEQVDEYRTETVYSDSVVTSVKLDTDGQLRILLDDDRWVTNDQIVQISKKDEPVE